MSMRVGINATPAEVPATLDAFPGAATCRVFGAAGKGIPAWTAPAMTALRKVGAIAWPSFKDWTSDDTAKTMVTAWLDTLPNTVTETWLTYNHEPEGDLNSYEYRRRWVLLAKWVRAHRNAARIKLVPIHTLYPSRHKIWDRYNTDWAKWTGIWQQWAPHDATGRYVGDYMGWDCYIESDARVYEPPAIFFRTPIGAAHTVGVPLVIPELGALRVAGDLGNGRAEWIHAATAHLEAVGTHTVAWWHSTGTNGQDYRLADKASADAWREAIRRNA